MNKTCQCSDPGCPACHGHCRRKAIITLFRVDMEDHTGTPMCDTCADDAFASCLFSSEPPEWEDDQ